MNTKNTKKLVKDFPLLYRGKDLPVTENLMCFGFECGDGWFNIIYNLSKKIDVLCKEKNVSDKDYPMALQVKEKYGGLRFYLGGMRECIFDEVNKFVDYAEDKSNETCERCGDSGKQSVSMGWVTTLCNACRG